MIRGVAAIRTEHGEAGVDALRAAATGVAERALTSGTTGEDVDGLLGGFEAFLDRYSARRDGRLSAPPLVVRSLFKARWNAVHGLPPTTGLAPLELHAYWGWLALEATEVDPARRLDALGQYHRVADHPVPEAEATLLYLVGDGDRAAAVFAEIQRQRGTNLRLRNHELAAHALSVE
jgi:hypothetical protein